MAFIKNLANEWFVVSIVWKNAVKQHAKLLLAVVCELCAGVFLPSIVFLFQKQTEIDDDNITKLINTNNVLNLLIAIFIFICLSKISRILTAFVIADIDFNLRNKVENTLENMQYDDFCNNIDMTSSNGLTQEISMASGLIPIFYRAIRAFITIIAFCMLLMIISTDFIITILLFIAMVMISVRTLRTKAKEINGKLFQQISYLNMSFENFIKSFRLFKVFNTMTYAKDNMNSLFLTIRNISKKLTIVNNGQAIITELITYAVAVTLIIITNKNGNVNIGFLISFPAAILFIRNEALVLINAYQHLAKTESGITRLINILKYEKNNFDKDNQDKVNLESIYSLELRNITFKYEHNNKLILHNVNLVLNKGALYVITGESGTGKTTTLNLLMGLLKPIKGKVLINEHIDIDNVYNLKCAIVEQEPVLFDGSIYDNIVMGRNNIKMEDIMFYINKFKLSHIVENNSGLHNKTDKIYKKLSTGEKHRIALIRAIVGNPDIIVADETTSNLDQPTSNIIIQQLKMLAKQRIVVAVTHDTLFMNNADYVLKLTNSMFINIK